MTDKAWRQSGLMGGEKKGKKLPVLFHFQSPQCFWYIKSLMRVECWERISDFRSVRLVWHYNHLALLVMSRQIFFVTAYPTFSFSMLHLCPLLFPRHQFYLKTNKGEFFFLDFTAIQKPNHVKYRSCLSNSWLQTTRFMVLYWTKEEISSPGKCE